MGISKNSYYNLIMKIRVIAINGIWRKNRGLHSIPAISLVKNKALLCLLIRYFIYYFRKLKAH